MRVVLRITSGPHAGLDHVVDGRGMCVVGRSKQAHLAMSEDRRLSREHFRIEINPPLCTLRDLGSTNGTKINGLRVEEAQLDDGDVIVAGDSAFVVSVERTLLGSPGAVRCVGCGQAAAQDGTRPLPDATRPPGWLCAACTLQRSRFPVTHPDFLIERRIGGGGMGEVFLARQLSVHRQVAIKMMVPTGAASQKAREYFRREMEVLKDLLMPNGQCHRNIVTFYDIFEIDDQFQLIMEYVAGKNALDWVAGLSTPLPIASALRIGQDLLSALDYAHAKGYVHRDVKPSNVLVSGPPRRPRIKLSDFGLAKNFRENAGFHGLTKPGDIGGSVGFLSPDHIRDFRDVREPADIYGAGATLYFLLTLHFPFLNFNPHKGDAYHIILEHPPVPLRAHRPDAPEALERILRKALEKHPNDRWKSAAAMGEALRALLDAGGNDAAHPDA